MVICGPSGSGKSTLLRCVNGLEPYEKGEIIVDGVSLSDPKTNLYKLREIIFMDFGRIVERGTYEEFFNNPKTERAKEFLKQIL
jgi:ABC-type polar amino acid transport system ATPase subunit